MSAIGQTQGSAGRRWAARHRLTLGQARPRRGQEPIGRSRRASPTWSDGETAPAPILVRRWPERRLVVLGTAASLLIAVLVGSLFSKSAPGAFAVLYVLPVMLAGLELGVSGGLASALVACGRC